MQAQRQSALGGDLGRTFHPDFQRGAHSPDGGRRRLFGEVSADVSEQFAQPIAVFRPLRRRVLRGGLCHYSGYLHHYHRQNRRLLVRGNT